MTDSRRRRAFAPPRFGTDGLRGHAGEPPLDPETLRRVGAALGVWLQHHGPDQKRVVLGNDGRESAVWILEALTQGLATADCTAIDVGLTTTPALAFLTRSEPFVAGIMISASHNPANDNGIKLFDHDGSKLPDEAEREIEQLTTAVEFGELPAPRARERAELLDRYVDYLGATFPALDLTGATIVVDSANGGASQLAPAVLRAFGADVVPIACEPDGFNINLDCGALHPENIVDVVRQSGAVLGACLDGDGDRCLFVDDQGVIHDGDDLLATLAPHLKSRGALPGDAVVATVMSNLGLRRSLSQHGIRVETTPVGDRHVGKRMRDGGFALGAEQSGHVLFDRGDHLVGDGLFTALTVLSLPGLLERGSSRVFTSITRYPQILLNVRVLRKPPLEECARIVAAQEEIAAALGDDGRVVLRYSGTEPLCRVMIEGPDRTEVHTLAERLAEVVRAELAE